MSVWKGPRPWWAAAALAPALLVALDLLLEPRLAGLRLAPGSVAAVLFGATGRLVLLFLALLVLPPLLWRTGQRRMESPAAQAEARVAETLAHAQDARRAVREAMAALAQADARAATAAPGPAAPPARKVGRAALVAMLIASFLVASGGLAYAFLQVPEENVPSTTGLFHVHATFAVYVHGERLNYSHPAFDLSERGYLRSHLHVDDPDVMHVEIVRGQTLGDFLELATATRLEKGALILDDLVHGGARHETGPEGTLRVFVAHDKGDAWEELDDAPGYVIRDGDRFLVTYGNAPAEELAAQQASVQVGATG